MDANTNHEKVKKESPHIEVILRKKFFFNFSTLFNMNVLNLRKIYLCELNNVP